jgi:hypothetical protein
LKAVALVAIASIPLVSFAQSSLPVTRAQVRAELIRVEKAGYCPSDFSDTNYPSNILAAEAKVASQKQDAQGGGYGPSNSGTSQSGHGEHDTAVLQASSTYAHH